MQLCIDHEVIVDTTRCCVSLIKGKVQHPHQTIKNMFRIQFLSHGHSNEPCCLCYQYTIWLIYHIINRRLNTDPIVA